MTARALHFERLLGACLLVGFLRRGPIQFPRKTDRQKRMVDNTPSAEPFSSHGASLTGTAQKGVFRKAAGYWTVGYGERGSRLKDTRGLGYIAHLLRHPHIEFYALDLLGGIAGQREDEESSQAIQGL